MQRIEIIGNLAKDAVRVEGQNGGHPFMSFTVICNEKKGDNEVKASYEVTSAVTGVLDFLKKGKQVFVSGYPSARAFLSKDNQPAAQMRISAQSIELL
ncbi:MAG: single-stranded DNA-binding protein [Bacteroidales bacterium]|nr:single-stranded DNA-binding protein [Bacteroidales bacterium]